MAPIRVALIGLSAKSSATSWAAMAHLPYLHSPRGKSHYEIVALLNSSLEAAEAAKKQFNLPPAVKAYDNPASVAADPDIDLVVCSTRVDLHFRTVEPAIRAGKGVFVEWPLAENLQRAAALTGEQRLDNSIIGLQRRVSPIIVKLKQVLQSGRIGRVLSSNVQAFNTYAARDSYSEGFSYFTHRAVGGNTVSIVYAHMSDYVHDVLGEFASFDSRAQIQRPAVGITGKDGARIRTATSDVPDLVSVHGPLAKGKRDVVDGATLSVFMRRGPPFKGSPAFTWSINGEKGELLVSSPHGGHFQEPIKIELHEHASDEVEEIPWAWEEWQAELHPAARDIGELYERYARWFEGGKKPASDVPEEQDWPRLHDAVERHKEIQGVFDQFDGLQK